MYSSSSSSWSARKGKSSQQGWRISPSKNTSRRCLNVDLGNRWLNVQTYTKLTHDHCLPVRLKLLHVQLVLQSALIDTSEQHIACYSLWGLCVVASSDTLCVVYLPTVPVGFIVKLHCGYDDNKCQVSNLCCYKCSATRVWTITCQEFTHHWESHAQRIFWSQDICSHYWHWPLKQIDLY